MDTLHTKLHLLEQYLEERKRVAVAFSGGVDSAFLMTVAHRILGDGAVAVTACSCAFPQKELIEARELAKAERIRHIEFEFSPFQVERFAENPPDRCYHCKNAILKQMGVIAKEEGIADIVEGSNVDDAKDYRPGFRAVLEQGVLSPLKEMGFTKDEIRQLSKELGLPTWRKQSAPCLASRFAYGEPITKTKLWMVEQAEEYLHEFGFGQLRVRVHGELARIELMREDFERAVIGENRKAILGKLQKLGFAYVTLDLLGYRMGSMNEVLKKA